MISSTTSISMKYEATVFADVIARFPHWIFTKRHQGKENVK
jgi:hypothetical protein